MNKVNEKEGGVSVWRVKKQDKNYRMIKLVLCCITHLNDVDVLYLSKV